MTPEALHAVIRWTGRLSLLLFLAAYLASSFRAAWPAPWSRALVRRRRAIGLWFAASHTVHLAALGILFSTTAEQAETATVVVGGLGYVFLYLMAATSNDAAVVRLGARRWQLLHMVGLYYLWFVFTITSLLAVGARPWAAVPSSVLLLGALAFRTAVCRRAPAPA